MVLKLSDVKLVIASNELGKKAQDTVIALRKTIVTKDTTIARAQRGIQTMVSYIATQYKNNFDLQTRITRDSITLINNAVEISKRDYAIDRFIKARKTRKTIIWGTVSGGVLYTVGRFLFHIF